MTGSVHISLRHRYTGCSEVNMPTCTRRLRVLQWSCFVVVFFAWMFFAWMLAVAQPNTVAQKNSGQGSDRQKQAPSPPTAGAEYSGMYSFLRDGEFVQVTVEDHGRVTGFVSRYGDSESDRGAFLDHFFKSGKLEGNQLTFTTQTVHGVSFEFRGTVERGEGKNPGDEAYYLLTGTLVENSSDDAGKTSSRSRQVSLKSFPQDLSP